MKKKLSLALRFVISFSLVLLAIQRIKAADFLQALFGFSFLTISLIISTGIIQIIINSFIQKSLLKSFSIFFSIKKIILHNFISTIYLLAIPGFFAPDFYLGYYYTKQEKEYERVISALFINRVIGFIIFTCFAVIGSFIIGPKLVDNFTVEKGSINIIRIIAILGIGISMSIFSWYYFNQRIKKTKEKVIHIWSEAKENTRKLWSIILLKIGFNIVGLVGRLGIGYILGIGIPLWEFACIILTINFFISIPISINGIGVREAGYVGLLSILGVPETTAFLFALSEFGITLSAALIGALIYGLMKLNLFRNKLIV